MRSALDCAGVKYVVFGLNHGEKTFGEIVKPNAVRCKVRILEQRGRGRGGEIGKVWTVAYSLIRPATADEINSYKERATTAVHKSAVPKTPIKTPHESPKFSPFDHQTNLIMEAILGCYGGLSPENLTCDGEASATWVRQQSTKLRNQLNHLQNALGFNVCESDAYDWARSKDEFNKKRTG